MSAPSRYHLAKQHDGRGWMVLRLDALHAGFPVPATVVMCDLPEEGARTRLDDLRVAEIIEREDTKAECQKRTRRDHLVRAIAQAGKSWWPTARSKASHARMSRAELQLWKAIRDLKAHDGEDVR